jgi:NAD(P)-dependent dehydrogenase (short-subunit alcohol dehydrogenase family)
VSILDCFRLDGKKAFVTGSSKGIGRGYAKALLEAGADVALMSRNLAETEVTAHELSGLGGKPIALRCDVSKPEEVEAMLRYVEKAFGRVDIAVNNAGICINKNTDEMTLSDWQYVFDVNLTAVFVACKHVAPLMIANGGGSIINTGSMAAHIIPEPQYHCAYSASKAGLLHLTRSFAAEWAPYGVRVNSISPGYTVTELTKNVIKPHWYERVPMRKVAGPEDMAGALIYLASDASAYTTGADILIDGGFCCW